MESLRFSHNEEEAKARPKSSLATSSSYGLSCEVWLAPPLLARLDQLTTTAAAGLRGRYFAVHET